MGRNFFPLSKKVRKKVRILELGCGSGANLWMIAKEGFDSYGIDFSKTALQLCRKILKKHSTDATLKLSSMNKIPFQANFFDAVVDIVSMQHIPFSEHYKVYQEIKRVLKAEGNFFSYHLGYKSYSYKHSGGKIIDKYTVDNIYNPNAPLANNGVTCFLTENAIENMLIKTGFKNISIENVNKTYNNRKFLIQYLVVEAQK